MEMELKEQVVQYYVLIAEFINLYYIVELIPSSKKFFSIYYPHQ